jgi:homoserine dehydrogenase
VFVTHQAREADVQATVRELRDLEVVRRVGRLLRVIGD